jgi:hypothetical protein
MCRACRNAADKAKQERWVKAHPEEAKARYRRYEETNNARRRDRYLNDPHYKAQNRAAVRRYQEKNRVRLIEKLREHHRSCRQIVIALYGGQCACCNEDHWQFLALDHVNGGGNRHRKTESVTSLYRRLAKIGVVDPAFQLLCHNCNLARGFYGVCPHEIERGWVTEVS